MNWRRVDAKAVATRASRRGGPNYVNIPSLAEPTYETSSYSARDDGARDRKCSRTPANMRASAFRSFTGIHEKEAPEEAMKALTRLDSADHGHVTAECSNDTRRFKLRPH